MKIRTVNSPPQQPDDFGYVNNRPRVLRVTNFQNQYLYISVHTPIKNNTTIIVYPPPKKGLSLLTSCSGRNFNCSHCLDVGCKIWGLWLESVRWRLFRYRRRLSSFLLRPSCFLLFGTFRRNLLYFCPSGKSKWYFRISKSKSKKSLIDSLTN